MHRFMHNCICTVHLVTWLFCSLYDYSANISRNKQSISLFHRNWTDSLTALHTDI